MQFKFATHPAQGEPGSGITKRKEGRQGGKKGGREKGRKRKEGKKNEK
jgi:hypothetical protein